MDREAAVFLFITAGGRRERESYTEILLAKRMLPLLLEEKVEYHKTF